MLENVLKSVADLLLKAYFIGCALVVIMALTLPSCSVLRPAAPSFPFPDTQGTEVATSPRIDTIEVYHQETVTDTVLIPGETITIVDSIECPQGLTVDSTVYIRIDSQLPQRTLYLTRTIHDTVFVKNPYTQYPSSSTGSGAVSSWWWLLLTVPYIIYILNRRKNGKNSL